MWTVCVYVLVITVMCRVQASGTSLMFELADKKRFCLSETFQGPKDYILEYRVIRGGKQDVDVSVKSPNGKVLYKKAKMKEGRFEFETSRGDYTICFGNEFSSWAHKLVYFDLRPADIKSLAGEAGVVKPFVKTAAETACDDIHLSMTSIVEYQRDYRLKESIGRHLAEGLLSHVSWWSVGQTIIVLLTGIGQTLVLKHFFTDTVDKSLIKEET